MAYENATPGRPRANTKAHGNNAFRLEESDPTGTSETQVIEIDTTGKSFIEGLKYTTPDGDDITLVPFDMNHNNVRTGKQLPIDADVVELTDELGQAVRDYEVQPVLRVERDGTTLTVTHAGYGRMTAVVVDGADESTAPA